MYIEYSPDKRLQGLIECYWLSNDMLPDLSPQRIRPDGCVDIIFSFRGDNSADLIQQGLPFLVGTMTYTFETAHSYGIVEMIGIRFKPAGITAFTKIPVTEFTNQHIDLNLLKTIFDSGFYQLLPEIKSTEERIAHIQNYMLAFLPKLYTADKQIQYISDKIIKSNGQLPVKDIVASACLSERQFERRFKAAIGITPKTFSKITRFNHTHHYIKNHPDESLFHIAISCGYYDHSHLIHDFKSLGDELPKEYV
jgi:AraC-like DNA-binding protein